LISWVKDEKAGEYFNDSDFEEQGGDHKAKGHDKKVTYKDVIRRDALKKIDDDMSGNSSGSESDGA